MSRYCLLEHRRLDAHIRGLAHVRFRVQEASQRIDDAIERLRTVTCDRLIASREVVREHQRELAGLNPLFLIQRALVMVPLLIQRLERQVIVLSQGRRRRIEAIASQLSHLSPLGILARGYSILTKSDDGTILRKAEEVQRGEEIVARLSQGRLSCTVKRVLPDPLV